ncbi:MAG TPA: hypothetical protein VHA35_06865 [Dongiaceae bacterium]|nr:hypothetical protein [Dongiaceae bacterium]
MTPRGKERLNRLKAPASILLSLALIALAGYGLHHALRHVRPQEVVAALRNLSTHKIALALIFSGGSFLAIGSQEYFALRTAGHPLALPKALFGGFLAQSIGHQTGFSVAVGGGLRYRFYSAFGVNWRQVAKTQASFSATLGLALCFQLAIGMLLHPALFDHAIHLPPSLMRGIGGLLGLFGAAVLALTARKQPVTLFGESWGVPPTGLVLAQVVCSVLDLACLAAAAWVLLPDQLGADYSTLLGVAVASLLLGIVSSVPGGLGIFESSVLTLLAPNYWLMAGTFGALLAFRAIYYLLPLLLGLIALGGLELWRRARMRPGA